MKRATPIIALLIIALLAYGSAYAVNRVIASFFAVPDSALVVAGVAEPGEPDAVEADAGAATRSSGRRDYVDGILKRNIFDAEFIALYNPSASEADDGGESERKTDLKVRLIGTVVADPAAYS